MNDLVTNDRYNSQLARREAYRALNEKIYPYLLNRLNSDEAFQDRNVCTVEQLRSVEEQFLRGVYRSGDAIIAKHSTI